MLRHGFNFSREAGAGLCTCAAGSAGAGTCLQITVSRKQEEFCCRVPVAQSRPAPNLWSCPQLLVFQIFSSGSAELCAARFFANVQPEGSVSKTSCSICTALKNMFTVKVKRPASIRSPCLTGTCTGCIRCNLLKVATAASYVQRLVPDH